MTKVVGPTPTAREERLTRGSQPLIVRVVASPARRLSLPLLLGIPAALGVFSTIEAMYYVSLVSQEQSSILILLQLNMAYWWSWAILVPGVLWMARRFRFARQRWWRALAAHVPGVIFFVAVHTVFVASSRVWILGNAGEPLAWWPEFQRQFFLNFDWGMMTYWAIVGGVHAFDFHRESQEQALETAHLETRLAEAQLQALQRQLHPHFLFNTLHAISALMHRDTEAADAMLERRSDLLRLTLDRIAVQEVTLRDELEFVEKYLEIEQTRFGDRLQVRTSIDPATLDAAVPNLLLQPLVENAVRHGIAPKLQGGHVEISSRRDGDTLAVQVRDDGPGLSQAARQALNAGVGLSNTRARLEHLYRDRFTFEFIEQAGGGLAVRIVVPFVIAAEQPQRRMEIVA
jgi:signal transduction histidine kinase